MSKVISFTDLKLIEELSLLTEMDMLHPMNDAVMLKYLHQIGMDVDYPVEYIPTKHRNMQNKVVIGYQAVGELRCDREFINSPFCSTIERVAVSSYTDNSLTKELAGLMNNTLDFNSFKDIGEEGDKEDILPYQIEPDYKELNKQLRQLEDIRNELRGDPIGADGSPASREEVWKYWENKRDGLAQEKEVKDWLNRSKKDKNET